MRYEQWTNMALNNEAISPDDALCILEGTDIDLLRLVTAAGDVRMKHFGRRVQLHQINNIKNGFCPEDCGYCGQSKISCAPVKRYRTKSEDDIVAEAHQAKKNGVFRYCMAASGRGPSPKEAQQLAHVLRRIRDEVGIRTCLSAGLVSDEQAEMFKEAGLDRLNHSLNTSESHTAKIVTTHTYQDRVNTLKAAKKAGIDNCSGMICGMGESNEDIIEVAFNLRKMEVPSIPINFLLPIPGNRLQNFHQLSPSRCLRILCFFRFVNPKAEIRIAGGREYHLRGMQSLALYPANSLFIEGYLVTKGETLESTYQFIHDAGFEVEGVDNKKPDLNEGHIHGDKNILNPKTAFVGNET